MCKVSHEFLPCELNCLPSTTALLTKKKPTMFHPAYQLNAPCGLNARSSDGQVTDSTKLKNQVVAVANDIPIGRIYRGYASAEYVKGTGPSPGEYTIPKR